MKKEAEEIRFDQNECDAGIDDNDILFVKVVRRLKTKTAKVVVPYTHNAMIVKNGGDTRFCKEGTYDVFEDGKDFKVSSVHPVEVVYIIKDTEVPLRWGTPSRLQYRDKTSNEVITVGMNGDAHLSIDNFEQFYRKMVGNCKEYLKDDFRKQFMPTIASAVGNIFLHTVQELDLTYDMFDMHKTEIGERLSVKLAKFFKDEWGVCLKYFNISEFFFEDKDIEAIKEKSAQRFITERRKAHLDELERLENDPVGWERYLRRLELENKEDYDEIMKVIANHRTKPVKTAQCPICKKEIDVSAKFCPHCGARVGGGTIICPDCGFENSPVNKFCAACGKKLA